MRFAFSKLRKQQNHDSRNDGDISDIENACAKPADTDVHEIDDSSVK